MKVFQMIFFGVICIILYEKEPSTLDSYFQNTNGALFFLTLNICFSGIFASVNVFSQ
jgi:hypothetical protein